MIKKTSLETLFYYDHLNSINCMEDVYQLKQIHLFKYAFSSGCYKVLRKHSL